MQAKKELLECLKILILSICLGLTFNYFYFSAKIIEDVTYYGLHRKITVEDYIQNYLKK